MILEQVERLLTTEHLLQENIKAGATIGELINVDEVFRNAFSYQNRGGGTWLSSFPRETHPHEQLSDEEKQHLNYLVRVNATRRFERRGNRATAHL